MKVLTELREQKILQMLNQKKIIRLEELTESTGASIATIRRDVRKLEDQGVLVRLHGGIKLIEASLQEEPDFNSKAHVHVDEKMKVGKKAAQLVKNSEVIFVDAGTSTEQLIKYLDSKIDVLVVTNSVNIANNLAEREIETYILGGKLKLSTRAITGMEVLEQISNLNFDRAFIGINGVTLKNGLTTPDPQEAEIKKMVLKHSKKAYCMLDYSKFDTTTFAKVADVEEVELIAEKYPDWVLNNKNIQYVEVDK